MFSIFLTIGYRNTSIPSQIITAASNQVSNAGCKPVDANNAPSAMINEPTNVRNISCPKNFTFEALLFAISQSTNLALKRLVTSI